MPIVDTSAELRVTVARLNPSAYVATITNELDLHNAAELRDSLSPLATAPRTTVIADLCGAPFIDSTALGVLTGLAKQLRDSGGELVVASDDPRLRRLLEITGLLSVLRYEPSLAAAVEKRVGDSAS
jgi:anti-sigma B factor antagonist